MHEALIYIESKLWITYFEQNEKKGSAERSETDSYFEQSEKKGSER